MGCAASAGADRPPSQAPSVAPDTSEKSKEIDRMLKADGKAAARRTKILLLGAGESGKTTILKQIRLMQDQSFSREEREDSAEILWQNGIQAMQAILVALMEMDYSLASPDVRRTAQYIHTLELPQPLDVYIFQVAPAIQSLWLDPAVQATFRRSREFQLVDSASYLFDRMPAMATKGWLPTDQDMLRVRIKTTGIQELHFTIKEAEYAIFDVGGQKSERRKWLSVFENVDVLLFVAAASEFDQTMLEDNGMNRWTDTEALYDATVNSKWLSNCLLVLFLNKADLFKQKIDTPDGKLSKYFPEYPSEHDHDFAHGCKYLLKRLTNTHKDPKRRYYSHVTTATSEQMRAVMMSVVDTIISNLKNSGFLI